MPFVEVHDFDVPPEQRRRATQSITGALSAAFAITDAITSVYFCDHGGERYGHAGIFPAPPEDRRVFVKVHAFRRDAAKRRDAARGITDGLSVAYALPVERIAVYFLDRASDEVAHGGILASD